MPTKDGFTPDHPLPLFLCKHADEPARLPIVAARDRRVVSSRVVLMTSTLIATATVIGILAVGDPVALIANVKASLLDISALHLGVGQSAIQSTPAPKNLPPTVSNAPARLEIATALEPADQSQTKISQPSTEDLFRQFQTWAAEEDKRAKVERVPPVQDAPEQVVQDTRPELRIMKTHRRVWHVRHARSEIRPLQNSRKRVRQAQNARVQVRPVQDARAQIPPAQQSLSAAGSESEK